MLSAAGLGDHDAEDIGPTSTLAKVGVVDVVVDDERAAVVAAKTATPDSSRVRRQPASRPIRTRCAGPFRARAHGLRRASRHHHPRRWGTVVFLREAFAPELVTALGRIAGRPVGFHRESDAAQGGGLTSDGCDKAARFLQLCDAFGIPLVSLVDTPGIMAGPAAERTAILRHASRLLVAGPGLSVPLIGVVRRGYGPGAQAMLGGSTREPLITVAWPLRMGPMGLEGPYDCRCAKNWRLSTIRLSGRACPGAHRRLSGST